MCVAPHGGATVSRDIFVLWFSAGALLSLPRWRLCYRFVAELCVPVEHLHGLIEKYAHHAFLPRCGASLVLLENLVEAIVVPDRPVVLDGARLLLTEHLRQIQPRGRPAVEVGWTPLARAQTWR